MSDEPKLNEDELDQDTVILDERDVKIARLEEAARFHQLAIELLVRAMTATGQQRTDLVNHARLQAECATDYLASRDD